MSSIHRALSVYQIVCVATDEETFSQTKKFVDERGTFSQKLFAAFMNYAIKNRD